MKVLFVTGFTPAKENIRGVSAHPYFLLKFRPSDVEVLMITYNINQMSSDFIVQLQSELNLGIIVEKLPMKIKMLNNRFSRFLKGRSVYDYILPSEKVKNIIKKYSPDVIWAYPNFFYKWAYILPRYKFVHSAPDSNVLSCARDCSDSIASRSLLRRITMEWWYQKSLVNDKLAGSENSIIHFVGMDDLRMYRRTTKTDNGFFLLHPHYLLKDKIIHFGEKIKVLVAGHYDFYMKSGFDDILNVIKDNPYRLNRKLSITFLGKDWESVINQLREVGYDCNQIKWVDHYIDEVIKYDIQLTPITVGTGTKGKVLDAIGNGLLCIGTPYALENIAVRDKESCLCYKDAHEISAMLNSIYYHHEKYEQMAAKGRDQVRKYHDPSRISRRFFGIIQSFLKQ